ncbi:putative protein kinase AGC-RSK-2 family [Rosa chinensis]|uniref:non-specific serine/threonine protein kinase n=1 Tax=Rosa chinensis TaxID=74649 RepID=A0A2P6RBL4_ROSCH|nr:serine/threonine-protein kinase D6PKL1 [Rosa chinensis]PRQ43821.1 putative protein kinase AGC-RSK-2 family [Rosa chinensis]
MGSFVGTSEIVEATDEPSSGQYSRGTYRPNTGLGENDRKLPALKLGSSRDSIEDDINKLFAAIHLKTSSKGSDHSKQVGTSPLNKNALKKPITMGVSHSPRFGTSEPATLKQALRELSITKASEMAAMKRLTKLTSPSRASEAGRIKTLYNAVVVQATQCGPSSHEDRGNIVEISLVPEESTSYSRQKMPDHPPMPKTKSSSQSAHSSPRFVNGTTRTSAGSTAVQNESTSTLRTVGVQTIKSELGLEDKNESGSDLISKVAENLPAKAVSKTTLKAELGKKEKHKSTKENNSVSARNSPTKTKLANKVSAAKPGRKVKVHGVPSSSSFVNGNVASKFSRNTLRSVKPSSRNKSIVKKKQKQDSISPACKSSQNNEADADIDACTSQLVCERCHIALKGAGKQSNQALATPSLAADISSSNVRSSPSKPGFTVDSCKTGNAGGGNVAKAKKNPKSKGTGEFSQSSKSSQGEHSSSTSLSDESNLSRTSCSNKPHMSKDVRWEAIRHVRTQYGALGLRHFNLLKKLGCGDIGTVYLAELISTNCLFAIKVMDNEFLARRKKMPRAHTESEILRMLDHPFLPTLYSQFTSDNLSCLVMEYCPGGDLHVLRQKQVGRCFSEAATRFYVAEVLLALEYLHMLGVVYRDLKPENILVREDGHIMLTDFDLSLRCSVSPTLLKSPSCDADPARLSGPCTASNCAEPFCIEPSSCQVSCFSPRFLPAAAKTRKLKNDPTSQVRSLPQLVAEPSDARSNSFVGTHEYLAPEIIKGDGHGAAVDWWTFGIFLYELLYGRTPFKGANNEDTLGNVVLQSLRFPDAPIVSFQARDLIRGLLVKEPENRLGTEKGAGEIKQHPFFEGLNWALIRCAVPPELPDFCDFEVPDMPAQDDNAKYLEFKTTGEHLEFELF